MNEAIRITITAPIIEGIRAIPASDGPHVPNSACPTKDPTSPAIVVTIQPILEFLEVKAPAITPIKAPTISDQIIKSSPIKMFVNNNKNYYIIVTSQNIRL